MPYTQEEETAKEPGSPCSRRRKGGFEEQKMAENIFHPKKRGSTSV